MLPMFSMARMTIAISSIAIWPQVPTASLDIWLPSSLLQHASLSCLTSCLMISANALAHKHLVPTCFQSLAVKDFYFMVRGICRGFFVKFLAANFPGNRRTTIGDFFRQIFATFFAHVSEKFRQSFALRAIRHKKHRTIAIASDFRIDGAKSPEILQKGGVSGSEIAARNRQSLTTFHRSLKSQCSIAVSCLGNR